MKQLLNRAQTQLSNVLELLGFACIVAAVWALAGTWWGIGLAGVFLLLVSVLIDVGGAEKKESS